MYIHRKLKPSSSQEEGYPFFKRKTFFPRSPGLDLIFIQYAFAWLPPLSSAQTIQEKQHWLDFWLQCVDLLQWTVGEGKPDIQKIEGTPYEFDRWVFKHLPNILLYVDDPKVERDLWEPILRLGQPGEHWAEDFLQEWFLSGARVTKRHDAFVRIWQDMLAYVETHPNWHMWCSMMGWESIALEFLWTEDSAKLLAQRLSPDYERWAKKHLNDHRNVECLCRFLETPAATSIFGQGIQWLADALPPDGFWYDAYQQIENSLVRLLAQYHTQHGTLHGLDAKQRESFLRLLRALVERHNKQAMALQEAILNV